MAETSRVTEDGRTAIPETLREKYGFEPGDELVWKESDIGIVVRKKAESAPGASRHTSAQRKREAAVKELEDQFRQIRDRLRNARIRRGETDEEIHKQAHDVEVTLSVARANIDAVAEKLDDQLDDRKLVKVRFLRGARANASTEELARRLAAAVDAEVVETDQSTAILHR